MNIKILQLLKFNKFKFIKSRLFKKKNKKWILNNYVNNKFIHTSDLKKTNKNEFYLISNYRLTYLFSQWLRLHFYAKKYLKTVNVFKKLNKILIYRYRVFLKKSPTSNLTKINLNWEFLYLYNFFFLSLFNDLYYFCKSFKKTKTTTTSYLILNFIKNKIFINLQDFKKNNFFFLSAGLFIKFFEKKKSFKKNKTIKMLMAKFLRKLFIVSKIKNTILVVKKTPLYLIEFLTLMNTPIIHKFNDPIEKKVIEEKNFNKTVIKFSYFIFLQNIDFSLNKGPQKGRIKRKILRKIVINNKLID